MEGQDVSLRVSTSGAKSAREEKEYFMAVSIKKTIVLIILALALLAGLFGWTVRMVTMPSMPYHAAAQSSRLMADGPDWYCPPPPRDC